MEFLYILGSVVISLHLRYGTGDFTLGIILEVLSDGQWEFVWAQQWFTMTDQLNMGVRHLMLDPVFFWDKMRLCHCGTTFKWFDKVLQFIEKVKRWRLNFMQPAGFGEDEKCYIPILMVHEL